MTREQAFEHVEAAIRSSACVQGSITERDTLEFLGMDDLDAVELLLTIEENLGIDIQESELEAVASDTVQMFVDCVMRKMP